jgi:hypothetical protein
MHLNGGTKPVTTSSLVRSHRMVDPWTGRRSRVSSRGGPRAKPGGRPFTRCGGCHWG